MTQRRPTHRSSNWNMKSRGEPSFHRNGRLNSQSYDWADRIGYGKILKGNGINNPAWIRKSEHRSMYNDFSGTDLETTVPGNKPNESLAEHPICSAKTELHPLPARPDKVVREGYSSGSECEVLVSLGVDPVKVACMLLNRKYASRIPTFPATETKVSWHVDEPQAIIMNHKPKRMHRHTYYASYKSSNECKPELRNDKK